MKKCFLTLLFLVTLTAHLPAVYVAWEMGGTDLNPDWWKGEAGQATSFKFVYSETALHNGDTGLAAVAGATTNIVADGAQGSSVYVSETYTSSYTYPLAPSSQANAMIDWRGEYTNGSTTGYLGSDVKGGWFYLVVFDSTDGTGKYSVAGSQFTEWDSNTSSQTGIYNYATGSEPTASDYVLVDNWLEGGTWGRSPGTPEPTTLTLLALGVAGLALRRKVR